MLTLLLILLNHLNLNKILYHSTFHVLSLFPNVSNIEAFVNETFKRGQELVFSLLDVHRVSYTLTNLQPTPTSNAKIQES